VLLAALRWASDPLKPLLSLMNVVYWGHDRVDRIQKWLNEPPRKQKNSQQDYLNYFAILTRYESAFNWLQERLNTFTKRTIVPVFTFLLVCMFLVTVLGYGLGMWAAGRLPDQAFQHLDHDYGTCLTYSLSVFTTAPLGKVNPLTWVGYLLYAGELFSTFLVVSVFFSMFSAAMGIHGRERIEELQSLRETTQLWITAKKAAALDAVNKLNSASPPDAN
jgi:hypothetical protein